MATQRHPIGEQVDGWADTLPMHDRAADQAGHAASILPRLIRSGRISEAAQLMRERGMSLRSALDVLRVCRARLIRPQPTTFATTFATTLPAHMPAISTRETAHD